MAGTPNFVKFQRGTLTAYSNLNQKDPNTLYFVYDTNDNTKWYLYLGDKLINNQSSANLNISDLADTLITEANTGDFLVRNSAGQWINQTAAQVANLISAAASSLTVDTNQFTINANNLLELRGFTTATAGLVPIKDNNNVLSWSAMPPDLSSTVSDLQSTVTQMQTDLAAVDEKILNANHLKYEIIANLSSATAANTVYLYPNSTTAGNNRYDEFMLINGALETLGTFAPDLSQYVTTSQLQAVESSLDNYVLTSVFTETIGDLSELTSYYLDNSNETKSVTENLEDIYQRLMWQEIN